MQQEMATIEQVAQDNHERARRLMKELSQMQQEYTELKKQVRPHPTGLGQSFISSIALLKGVFLWENREKLINKICFSSFEM